MKDQNDCHICRELKPGQTRCQSCLLELIHELALKNQELKEIIEDMRKTKHAENCIDKAFEKRDW